MCVGFATVCGMNYFPNAAEALSETCERCSIKTRFIFFLVQMSRSGKVSMILSHSSAIHNRECCISRSDTCNPTLFNAFKEPIYKNSCIFFPTLNSGTGFVKTHFQLFWFTWCKAAGVWVVDGVCICIQPTMSYIHHITIRKWNAFKLLMHVFLWPQPEKSLIPHNF